MHGMSWNGSSDLSLLQRVSLNIGPFIEFMCQSTQAGAAEALKKVKLMLYTAVGSFSFSLFKWFFQGTDYRCGFGIFPTFGMKAMVAGWNFDFQHNYVGAGKCF